MKQPTPHCVSSAATAVAVGLALSAQFAPVGHAADWPQYRGPHANGSTSEKIAATWPEGGPRQVWKRPLNRGFSSFAVAGNRAYTLVSRELDGVKREVCLGLDAATR